jgi:hypothetical protein
MIVFEMVIYILYLIIKALRKYIDSNSKTNSEELPKVRVRKSMKGILIVVACNVLIIVAITATVYVQKNHDIYYTENVIILQNKTDEDIFTELLNKNEIVFEVLDGTRVKMQNKNDFLKAEDIIKDNSIGFSTITIEK